MKVHPSLKTILALALMLACLFGAQAWAEDGYALPLDIGFENYAPREEGFTDISYHDDSLDVTIENVDFGGISCYVARIKVQSPTQLRTATAGLPNQNAVAYPSVMDQVLNAVITINGEFYVQRTHGIYIYRQGELYRNEPDPVKDVLIIDSQGDFHIFIGPDKAKQIQEFTGTPVNAFSFGPALMADGVRVPYRADYQFSPDKWEWRSFIGQDGPLSYVFCVMQGAGQKHMGDLAEQLGLKNAYGLDGGNSSVMLFHHQYVGDKRPENEREQSDVVYVVSAVKP